MQPNAPNLNRAICRRTVDTWRILAMALLAAMAGTAHAADDDSLTWNGITLYGVLDIGIAYQTHGTPLSQNWMVGLEYFIQKNSNKSITSIAPNGMSQSRIGLKGTEPIMDGLNFIFNLDSGFDPQSGNLADALKSLINNNGIPLANQKSAGDSSLGGQLFNRSAYAGLSFRDYGTITFGRQNTLLLDNILQYDPMGGSYAFSIIGLSGVTAGMGITQDARLDGSLKYFWKDGFWHAGALYQSGKNDSSPGEAWQVNLGFENAGFSIDGIYGQKKTAIAATSLSAEQAAQFPLDSLAATISDNTSWTLDAGYAVGAWRWFLGYEHIKYENPSNPLPASFNGLGGYLLSVVNNTAFPHPKILQVTWGGVKYLMTPDFDITGAFYHYDQNSYGPVRCSDTSAATCSGMLWSYSVAVSYRFTRRFDVYAGTQYSRVTDGLASGYLHTNTLSSMAGFRFKF